MAAQDQQQIDGQVALLRNLVEQLRKDMEAREREQDLQQDCDHWQNEAADWKRQAQNLLPAPRPEPLPTPTAEAPALAPAAAPEPVPAAWRRCIARQSSWARVVALAADRLATSGETNGAPAREQWRAHRKRRPASREARGPPSRAYSRRGHLADA